MRDKVSHLTYFLERAHFSSNLFEQVKQAQSREEDGKLHVAVHGRMWYIYVPYVHNTESVLKILRTKLKKMVDEENGCRFDGQRKETWIYMRPAKLIAVRQRMLEFCSD